MNSDILDMTCPVPVQDYPGVLMAHGSGGRMMNQLIGKMFLAAFKDVQNHDSAVLSMPDDCRLAMTTDSFVIRPLEFPGGDIGSLAVFGTVNDLAMSGAKPEYLSVSFIIEEGLAMETLWRIVQSMSNAAKACSVKIVTGDTKVVERGHGDGLYINTTGVGSISKDAKPISPERVCTDDAIILSGDIGRHGMAVMSAREGLEFESTITSDSGNVSRAVLEMLDAGIDVHCLRDATRGGLAAVLNEIAEASGLGILADENLVKVGDAVRGACEILGLDPLHVANEGRFVAFVSAKDAERAIEIINQYNTDTKASIIGRITRENTGQVMMKTPIGSTRILSMPSGELLPRIC